MVFMGNSLSGPDEFIRLLGKDPVMLVPCSPQENGMAD
jgi:hypothetical protein